MWEDRLQYIGRCCRLTYRDSAHCRIRRVLSCKGRFHAQGWNGFPFRFSTARLCVACNSRDINASEPQSRALPWTQRNRHFRQPVCPLQFCCTSYAMAVGPSKTIGQHMSTWNALVRPRRRIPWLAMPGHRKRAFIAEKCPFLRSTSYGPLHCARVPPYCGCVPRPL